MRCEGEWGVWTEGGTRTDELGDTMKRPQGGKEIRNGTVLAKGGKKWGVRAREVFKNNLQGCFV